MSTGNLSNTGALCFILGWQGGTISQVAQALDVGVDDVLGADEIKMGDLCRKAQRVAREGPGSARTLAIQLRVCVNALKADYEGHVTPTWLLHADEVCRDWEG